MWLAHVPPAIPQPNTIELVGMDKPALDPRLLDPRHDVVAKMVLILIVNAAIGLAVR
jgi:hypothetical protein